MQVYHRFGNFFGIDTRRIHVVGPQGGNQFIFPFGNSGCNCFIIIGFFTKQRQHFFIQLGKFLYSKLAIFFFV